VLRGKQGFCGVVQTKKLLQHSKENTLTWQSSTFGISMVKMGIDELKGSRN
jgi:hypothetical protein